jgi:uncharacterized protein YkwD
MKKLTSITSLILTLAMILTFAPIAAAADAAAMPSKQSFSLDGSTVSVAAYNIDDNNYVKLRDICKLMDYGLNIGSKGRNGEFIVYFSSTVGYSGAADANNGVMPSDSETATSSDVYFYFNRVGVMTDTNPLGQMVPGEHNRIAAYNINGNNYIQLRDMAQKIDKWGGAGADGFDVSFDSKNNSVVLLSNTKFSGIDMDSSAPVAKPKATQIDEQDYSEFLDDDDYRKIAEEIVRLTNEERAKEGLPALEIDEDLMTVAQIKSQDMADNDYFSHDSPTWGGKTSLIFPDYVTSNVKYWGENIIGARFSTSNTNDADGCVQRWMTSEGHRDNILRKDSTHIGVGVMREKGTMDFVATQVFGKEY